VVLQGALGTPPREAWIPEWIMGKLETKKEAALVEREK
jgi:hypothetical protein